MSMVLLVGTVGVAVAASADTASVASMAVSSLFSTALKIVMVLFAVLYFAKFENLRTFFNNRAGAEILGSKRRRYRDETIAAIVGGVLGVLQWGEALAGGSFMRALLLLLVVCLAIYLYRFYHKAYAFCSSAQVAKWMTIYKSCTMLMFAVIGLLLSIVALLLVVGSLFLKGADYVWTDAMTYRGPVDDGGDTANKCCNCPNWNSGYCSKFKTQMPLSGGCN